MLERIDALVAKGEKLLLLVSLGMMTILVGLDVAQRTFSRPVGRTESLVEGLMRAISGPLDEAAVESAHRLGGVVFVVVAVFFFVFGAHTARGVIAERANQPAPSVVSSAVRGVVVLVATAAFIKLVLVIFPSSVPGAQKFALGFMMWAGMLGASLATRERRHIVLDPIIKKLEGDDRRRFAGLSGLVTGLFCAFIATIGFMQLKGEIHDWATGEGVGLYPALPIPLWLGTLSIPVAFTVMTLRFWKNGAHDFKHGPPTPQEHGVDLEEVERLANEQQLDNQGDTNAEAVTA